jgi:hypothetical protein
VEFSSTPNRLEVVVRRARFAIGLAVLALATLSWAAWLAEMVFVKGWGGLRWLDGFPASAYLGVACVTVSVALPMRRGWPGIRRIAVFFAISYPIALLSFEAARVAIYALHPRGPALARGPAPAAELANLIATAAVTAVGFTWAARVALAPVRWRTAGWFVLAVALVMPMGMLTIEVVRGPEGHTDYFQVVKLGYPVFWTNVLMALASAAAARGIRRTDGRPG